MIIIETTVFTKRVAALLPDDDYRALQILLIGNPESGRIIPGSGGLRKIRWNASGRGKRGGTRIIYYWITSQDKILMLFVYSKNEMVDLSPTQIKILKALVEKELL